MSRYVALVRGINVGGNSKVPMPVLRSIFEQLGHTEVATLINSGNVVFTASGTPRADAIEKRIADETGVTTRVLILTAARLKKIAAAMPFTGDESRLIVTFMHSVPSGVHIPDDLGEELVQIGSDAVYQWLPQGVSNSKLKPSFWKQFPPESTGRNIRTVTKLIDLL